MNKEILEDNKMQNLLLFASQHVQLFVYFRIVMLGALIFNHGKSIVNCMYLKATIR